MLGSNDLVVDEDHLMGLAIGQVRFDSLSQLTLVKDNSDFKPLLPCGTIPLWKSFQAITSRKNLEWSL